MIKYSIEDEETEFFVLFSTLEVCEIIPLTITTFFFKVRKRQGNTNRVGEDIQQRRLSGGAGG